MELDNLVKELKIYKKRYYREEKTAFIRYILNKYKDDYEIIFDRKGRIRNLETNVSDPKVIIMTHYDTGTKNTILVSLFELIFGKRIGKLILSAPLTLLVILNAIFDINYYIIQLAIVLFIFIRFIPNKNNMNDNTSGVLLLLSLADKIKETEYKDYIKFVWTDYKEERLSGAHLFAKEHEKDLEETIIINVDSIGKGSTLIISSVNDNQEEDEAYKELLYNVKDLFQQSFNKVKIIDGLARSDYKAFPEQHALNIGLYNKALTGMDYYVPFSRTCFDQKINLEKIRLIESSLLTFIHRTLS